MTLHPGTCIFVPAWWWVQTITIGKAEVERHEQNLQNKTRVLRSEDDSLTIQMEFQPHSQLFDVINTGIELDLILGDENSDESQYRLETIQGKMQRDQEEMEHYLKK